MYDRLGLVAERSATQRHRALVEVFAGRLDDATASAERARHGFEQVGDIDGQGWALQHLAWIAFVRGDRPRAQARVDEAIELFDRANDSRGRAWANGIEAWIAFQAHRIDEAEAIASRTLDDARSRRDPWAMPMMTMLMASIRLWQGRTEDAVDLAAEAKRGFVALDDPYGIGQASAALGRSLVMAGRLDAGFAELADPMSPMVRATRFVVAAQLGEPGRADRSVFDDQDDLPFGGDLVVARGLVALHEGDVERAALDLAPRSATPATTRTCGPPARSGWLRPAATAARSWRPSSTTIPGPPTSTGPVPTSAPRCGRPRWERAPPSTTTSPGPGR